MPDDAVGNGGVALSLQGVGNGNKFGRGVDQGAVQIKQHGLRTTQSRFTSPDEVVDRDVLWGQPVAFGQRVVGHANHFLHVEACLSNPAR